MCSVLSFIATLVLAPAGVLLLWQSLHDDGWLEVQSKAYNEVTDIRLDILGSCGLAEQHFDVQVGLQGVGAHITRYEPRSVRILRWTSFNDIAGGQKLLVYDVKKRLQREDVRVGARDGGWLNGDLDPLRVAGQTMMRLSYVAVASAALGYMCQMSVAFARLCRTVASCTRRCGCWRDSNALNGIPVPQFQPSPRSERALRVVGLLYLCAGVTASVGLVAFFARSVVVAPSFSADLVFAVAADGTAPLPYAFQLWPGRGALAASSGALALLLCSFSLLGMQRVVVRNAEAATHGMNCASTELLDQDALDTDLSLDEVVDELREQLSSEAEAIAAERMKQFRRKTILVLFIAILMLVLLLGAIGYFWSKDFAEKFITNLFRGPRKNLKHIQKAVSHVHHATLQVTTKSASACLSVAGHAGRISVGAMGYTCRSTWNGAKWTAGTISSGTLYGLRAVVSRDWAALATAVQNSVFDAASGIGSMWHRLQDRAQTTYKHLWNQASEAEQEQTKRKRQLEIRRRKREQQENREQREGGGILNMLRRGVEQPKSSAKEAAKSSTGWWQLLSHVGKRKIGLDSESGLWLSLVVRTISTVSFEGGGKL